MINLTVERSFNYVTTAKENGCVVSCLAMITNQTFYKVLEEIDHHWKIEGQFEGVDDPCWMQYLANKGFAIQDISQEYIPQDRILTNWPLKPFAPIHMCFVYDEGPHAIIVDSTGTVFDPNSPHIKTLNEYHRVYRMVGIWKVSNGLDV